ncbi:hypothetical protein GF407_00670 [candidate division KSB1 bacterium]|nr:hypothetical protein [candidate division KSB1 bacterium]
MLPRDIGGNGIFNSQDETLLHGQNPVLPAGAGYLAENSCDNSNVEAREDEQLYLQR